MDALDVLIAKVKWKQLLPIAFALAMAAVDVCMMFTAKFVHLGRLSYATGLALATGVYLLQPYLFIKAMNYETMSAMNLIWNLASNIVVTVSGVLVFQEPVHGLRWVAIGMSLFAIGLFAYTGASSKQ